MKQYKKPLRLYLGRTAMQGSGFSNYQIGSRRKDWEDEEGFTHSFIASFCGGDFERVTGIRLEPREVVRVRIEVQDA